MNNDYNEIIGQRINAALALSNIKQKELAKELGVKDNVVSYWCSGKRTPNTEQIIEIADFLNVSTDYLLGLSDAATSDKDLQFVCDYTGLNEQAIDILRFITTGRGYDESIDIKNVNFLYSALDYVFQNGNKIIRRYDLQKDISLLINEYDKNKNFEYDDLESYHNSLDDTLLKLQALQYSLITNFNALIESDSNIKESVKLAEELKKDLENRLNKQLIEECYEPVFKNQIGSKYVIEVYENKNFKEDKTEKQ